CDPPGAAGVSEERCSSLVASGVGVFGFMIPAIRSPPPRPTATAMTTVPAPAKYAVDMRMATLLGFARATRTAQRCSGNIGCGNAGTRPTHNLFDAHGTRRPSG